MSKIYITKTFVEKKKWLYWPVWGDPSTVDWFLTTKPASVCSLVIFLIKNQTAIKSVNES